MTALLQEVAVAPERREEEPLSLAAGTVIGRFEIVRELGSGAFGVVYEARDRDLGRQVAVKIVRPGRALPEEGKVTREAEAIARLLHPNLITLFDVGRSEAGPYLVFELLRGKTLEERMADGPMPVQEALHVATEVARGLAHAHAEGVIHRDLKPANVFVTNRGQVKILDFGMAHAFGRRRLSGGTPAYMAPEQWEDAPEDERTDVFALGVMLYRMLTGEYPYPEGKGKWSAEAVTVRKIDVPAAPEVAELVEKMLERNPTARPRDGAAVLAALTPIEDRLRARPADRAPPIHAKRRKATFGDLLAELRRRHVFRVMIGYGVFAFAVLQITEPIMHGAHLPDWVLTVVLVGLVLGFPVAVVLAWAYDLTAKGVKRTPSATGPGAPRFGRSRLLLPLAVSGAVLAIAAVGAGGWYAWQASGERRESSTAVREQASVAVLPFVDLNPPTDQDHFADGIAEEILGALSRVRGLHVPGRSPAFWFKGRNVEPAEVARKLGVTHLLEGTVRRTGGRVRVTAEVVKASSGDRVWREVYERDLADIFAIQDDIARSVVQALAPVLLAGSAPLPSPRTTDPEAYRLFLLGRFLNGQATEQSFQKAVETLERSAAIDPHFAPTQALLGFASGNLAGFRKAPESLRLRKVARESDEKAVALAPSSSWGYAPRAWHRMAWDLDWSGAAADLERGLAIDPESEFMLNAQALFLLNLGRTRESVEVQRRAVARDPLSAIHTSVLAVALLAEGKYPEAREWARRAEELSPGYLGGRAHDIVGWAALEMGHPQEALASWEHVADATTRLALRVIALHALGRELESRDALARLEREHPDALWLIASARARTGDVDGAFEALDRVVRERRGGFLLKVSVALRPLRGDPRFKDLLRGLNLPVD